MSAKRKEKETTWNVEAKHGRIVGGNSGSRTKYFSEMGNDQTDQ